MFTFYDKFNELSDDIISLKIIEKFQGNDVMLPFYYYDIYENKSNEKIGKISIRIGNNYHSYFNGHIGYEIDEIYRGHNYSLLASKILLQVAKKHDMTFIYLTCNKSNSASRKIIEKLGGELIEIIYVPKDYFGWRENMEQQCIFKLNL
ncbi:MAG: GNAT family N-acetyltransferase [Turicibacter sp.]